MTKKEKLALRNVFNKINSVMKEQDDIFNELQDLARENGTDVHCSAYYNMRELVKLDDSKVTTWGCKVSERADDLYKRYMNLEGQREQLMELGCVLNELGMWRA